MSHFDCRLKNNPVNSQEAKFYLASNEQREAYFGYVDFWNDGVEPLYQRFIRSLGIQNILAFPLREDYPQDEYWREADRVDEVNKALVADCMWHHPAFFYSSLSRFNAPQYLFLGLCLKIAALYDPAAGRYNESEGENNPIPRIDPNMPQALKLRCLRIIAMESHPLVITRLGWQNVEKRLQALEWEQKFFSQGLN